MVATEPQCLARRGASRSLGAMTAGIRLGMSVN